MTDSGTSAAGRKSDEAGFTLIELLIVIVILGVIALPLGNAVIGFFRNSNVTSGRLAESHDAQIAAAYWQQDIAALGAQDNTTPLSPTRKQSVELNVAYNSGNYPCGTAGTPAALIRLVSDNVVVATTGPSAGMATTTVSVTAYVVETPTGGGRFELHRLRCNGATLVSDIVVMHDLLSSPTVTCSGANGSTCTGSGTGVPSAVSLALTIQDLHSSGTPYALTLTGQRRQS